MRTIPPPLRAAAAIASLGLVLAACNDTTADTTDNTGTEQQTEGVTQPENESRITGTEGTGGQEGAQTMQGSDADEVGAVTEDSERSDDQVTGDSGVGGVGSDGEGGAVDTNVDHDDDN